MPDGPPSEGRPPGGGQVGSRLRRLAQRPTSLIRRLAAARPRAQGLVAFFAYALASLALWGRQALGRLSTTYVGVGREDAKLYTWSLRWWPYALSHGLNPFLSRVVWAPTGINMAWVTGLPGPSILSAPFTLLLGPIVVANVLTLLAPALAAWGAYLLCRRIADAFWPALAGGYLFGFSTYEVGQMHGHLNLILIFPVPLCVYLVLRRLDGSIGRGAFVALLAAGLIGQFSISTEVFATMTLFGAVAFAGAVALGPGELRTRLFGTGALVASAYAAAGVFLSPYLFYVVKGAPSRPVRPLEHASTDLLSFVAPRHVTLIGGLALQRFTHVFTLNAVEDGAYLGIPILLVVLLFGLTGRRRPGTWPLLGFLVFLVVASLGPVLHVHGHPTVRLPWSVLAGAPIVQDALPERFTAYIWLTVAVVASLWVAEASRRQWARWGLVALGALAILPDVSTPPYFPPVRVPAFFSEGTYRRYLAPGEIVMPIPFGRGEGMLWQADTNMYFRQAGGYVGPVPTQYQRDPAVLHLSQGRPELIDPQALSLFVTTHDVGAVVVDDAYAKTWQPLLGTLGVQPDRVGGVMLYRLHATPGHPVEPLSGVSFAGDLRPGGTLESFVLPRLGGSGNVTYRGFRGTPLVLEFFASWCGDCLRELRGLVEVQRSLGSRAGFLGVAQSDRAGLALAAARGLGVGFPTASDSLGRLFSGFEGTTMPLTVFIRPQGRIAAVRGGLLSPKAVVALMARDFGPRFARRTVPGGSGPAGR